MFEYYRQLIPHFSKLEDPLVQILQNDVPFVWRVNQDSVFNALREALVSSLILVHLNFGKSFVLFTNASDVTVWRFLSNSTTTRLNTLLHTLKRPCLRLSVFKVSPRGSALPVYYLLSISVPFCTHSLYSSH